MKIGISTASFHAKMLTEDAISYLGKNGVGVCEVFLDTYSEYEPEMGEFFSQRAKSNNIEVCAVHAMSQQFEPQLFSIGERSKRDAWAIFRKVLAVAKLLGASVYVMHGPATMSGVLKNAALERIIPIADELAELSAEYGIKLCWENVSWCLFNSPTFAKEVNRLSKSDNLKFTLDIKQTVRSRCDLFELIDAMGHRLSHLHLLDYSVQENGSVNLCLPCKGSFDFQKMATALKQSGFSGVGILETYSDLYHCNDEVIESYKKLEEIFNFV